MSIIVFGNFILYCIINAFTPGPGNVLALNTVTNYGYRKGQPLFFGIFAGYYVVQLICALIVYSVSSLLPSFLGILKYLGAAYIIWLAYHVLRSEPTAEASDEKASFVRGFILQFVNVKIYLFGVTALTGFVVGYYSSLPMLVLFEFIIATFGTIATSTWIGLGVLIQDFYLKHVRIINIVLALTLVECAWSMLSV